MVRTVMKKDMNMSYRKAVALAPKQNSVQNICLRAAWAKEYLKLLDSGKTRIINVDESIFTHTQFYNFIWADKDSPSSTVAKPVNPRISLIMALSTTGAVYSCLTHVNTTSQIMKYYF